MFNNFVLVFFIEALLALFVAVSCGTLFAFLTLKSNHVRWCLPSLALAFGFYVMMTGIELDGLRWQQPVVAFALGWWVMRDYRPLGSYDQKYSDVWSGAVLKSGAILLAFMMLMITPSVLHLGHT